MKFISILTTAAAIGSAAAAPHKAKASDTTEFFIIRHAEKNPDGTISSAGMQREQCLINVFGSNSDYNIQHIMTQHPYPDSNTSQRPYNTTLPLANSLGLTIDTPCDYTDTDCAGREALKYVGTGNVLIAWEHGHIKAVAEAIGASDAQHYPGSHFDWIYNIPSPYDSVVSITSENCPGLDD